MVALCGNSWLPSQRNKRYKEHQHYYLIWTPPVQNLELNLLQFVTIIDNDTFPPHAPVVVVAGENMVMAKMAIMGQQTKEHDGEN